MDLGVKESYDCGLKLFLDKDDLERLYDFEEESMEGLVRERETKHNQTTDERVRLINDRLDGLSLKIDDPHRQDGHLALDSIESRLSRLENSIEQTNIACLAIARHCSIPPDAPCVDRTTSATLSEATTLTAGVMDGEKWTSSPLSSTDGSSSSDDQSCSELGFSSTDGAIENVCTPAISSAPAPPQRKQSVAKKMLTKLNVNSATISNLNEEQPKRRRISLFEPSAQVA